MTLIVYLLFKTSTRFADDVIMITSSIHVVRYYDYLWLQNHVISLTPTDHSFTNLTLISQVHKKVLSTNAKKAINLRWIVDEKQCPFKIKLAMIVTSKNAKSDIDKRFVACYHQSFTYNKI